MSDGDVAAAVAVGIGLIIDSSIRPVNMTTRARLLLVIMFELCTDMYGTLMACRGRNKGVFS